MLCTKFRFPWPRSRSQSKIKCLSHTNRVSSITEKSVKGIQSNFKEGVSRPKFRFTTKVKVTVQCHRFVIYKSCVHNNSITAEVYLTKFNRMVEHNEKMCRAQNLGSHDEGQVHTL